MKGLDTRFVRTAARPDQFINDGLPQIAFAGRSNVGKSSVINCLTGKSSLARVSSVPGKTTSINYYLVNEKFYFVDLPGFGYARTSQAEKERWAALMEDYFNRSGLLSLGIQLVDIRHDPMPGDMIMTKWFLAAGARFLVAANKSDKISRSAVPGKLEAIRSGLGLPPHVQVIEFSARLGTGKKELLREITGTLA
jgi:GTP-binding protein